MTVDNETPLASAALDTGGNAELNIADLSDREFDLLKISIVENAHSFRSLNQIMWQVPILAMTLTGGLWFGVASLAERPLMSASMLIFAGLGNFCLAAVLYRVRHVIGRYLDWSRNNNWLGRLALEAPGRGLWKSISKPKKSLKQPRTVARTFIFLLIAAGVVSFSLALSEVFRDTENMTKSPEKTALAYYEKHADAVAENYDELSFEEVHSSLFEILSGADSLEILDVGAGSGRDACWMGEQGHKVIAAEPSRAMLAIGRSKNCVDTEWVQTGLPYLGLIDKQVKFDLIHVSAVWMHVHPSERRLAIGEMKGHLKEDGAIYISLRLGSPEADRGIYEVSEKHFSRLLKREGLQICWRQNAPDLQGRTSVSWVNLLLSFDCASKKLPPSLME